MATYSKITNFGAKDNLVTGNPSKIIYGAEFDAEFNAIGAAVNGNVAAFDIEHDDATGKHSYVTLPPVGSAPSTSATHGVVYTKDTAGVTELFYKDDDGTEVQMTSGGAPMATVTSTSVTTFTATESVTAPVVKTSGTGVTISAGNVTLDLDVATVFRVSVTEDCTVTLTAADATKIYQFTILATTTGAYNFTNITMSGVTVYKTLGTSINLQASGRTVLGCIYDGAGATLDVVDSEREAI